jgi:hypothetical protein
MAYKDLQRFQLKIIFQLKIVFLEKHDLHRFQLKGMVSGNRNIISPLRVRGLGYRWGVGVNSSCHNNKFDKCLSPSCLTSG